jgi:O-methyltransferase involved in polyketide biosynthesis
MKEEKPNVGAEQVAAIRAAESRRPEGERVCYDPLARHFLSPELGNIIDDPKMTETAFMAVEQSTPGAIGCIVARTRYAENGTVPINLKFITSVYLPVDGGQCGRIG